MWHRLTLRRSAGRPMRHRSIRRRCSAIRRANADRGAGWPCDARGRTRVEPFGWDNEFDAVVHDVAGLRHRSLQRHQRATSASSSRPAAIDLPALWSAEGWAWRAAQGVAHPLFWERAATGGGGGAACSIAFRCRRRGPSYVSHAEAAAYARWRGGRLPTRSRVPPRGVRIAGGRRARVSRGATRRADRTRGHFDFASWDPVPVGIVSAAGASAWGVEDLVGNGWEWTSTIFAPFRRVPRRCRRIRSTRPTSSTASTSC